MTARRPNILLIMTDQERAPPPYETPALAEFRRTQLKARQSLIDNGVSFHRHYVASTACTPSRASLFTGQYPSLHGVSQTDGLAKTAHDANMNWLDPDVVPTMGHWFQAAGYRTYYKGKWHISHADLAAPGTHEGLMTNDGLGNAIKEMVSVYEKADRLEPFGFHGWIGREPHGADRADSGYVKDGLYSDQVDSMFEELKNSNDSRPWLTVASFVNPHDIVLYGPAWDLLKFPRPDDTVPDYPEPASQSDSFENRPDIQRQFRDIWPQMAFEAKLDSMFRRTYMMLHKIVDAQIAKVLDSLDKSGLAENTIVIFTADHGEMLGSHGGMQQKWCTAFDEAIRVPFVVRGPGIKNDKTGIQVPTSHVDLIPTLLGLAGVKDHAPLASAIAKHHSEVHPLPGRDLSSLFFNPSNQSKLDGPVYFMTEDRVTEGTMQFNAVTRKPYKSVQGPANLESMVTPLSLNGERKLWKINRVYGFKGEPEPSGVSMEVYCLTDDPEERVNRYNDPKAPVKELLVLLEKERAVKRLKPKNVNPEGAAASLKQMAAMAAGKAARL